MTIARKSFLKFERFSFDYCYNIPVLNVDFFFFFGGGGWAEMANICMHLEIQCYCLHGYWRFMSSSKKSKAILRIRECNRLFFQSIRIRHLKKSDSKLQNVCIHGCHYCGDLQYFRSALAWQKPYHLFNYCSLKFVKQLHDFAWVELHLWFTFSFNHFDDCGLNSSTR